MLACFTTELGTKPITIYPILAAKFVAWREQQSTTIQNWLETTGFAGEAGEFCYLPADGGNAPQVICLQKSAGDYSVFAKLSAKLSAGTYLLADANALCIEPKQQRSIYLMWGIGSYQFLNYQDKSVHPAKLYFPEAMAKTDVLEFIYSMNLVRDLINTPTADMGPAELAAVVKTVAKQFKASVDIIEGDRLLKKNYPLIHAVGRGSARAPRLIDLTWGDKKNPKVTLVGKGVCFDSGGLDLKSTAGMALMKKDMGGSAHALGLARLIMAANLPLRLRLLIPAVENMVSGNSYIPGDVLTSRAGLTVEITNTDAEGRLILADALAEACSESPDYLFDFATLTGAAKIALGPRISAMFSNNGELAEAVDKAAIKVHDPVWRMPLYQCYAKYLKSDIADMVNAGGGGSAGCITAALFLQKFVEKETRWMHFDIHAWNPEAKPGKPKGAAVMAIRAVFEFLKNRF